MASFNLSGGHGDGDDTDRSVNRRMRKMGKSKPVYETESDETDESESEEEETLRRGEWRKSKTNSSRYRSRSTKRVRGTPSGLTPKAKEARIDAEPRFSAKFDGDGVLIEASAEREAANRRARIDKEKRYIAEARPHKARSGGGGGGDLDDWQTQRGRSTGRGRGRNDGNSRIEDRNGKNLKIKHLKPNSGATNEAAAAKGSNSLGDTAPPTAVAQNGAKTTRPMARNNLEQGGSAPPAPDNSDNSLATKVMNHLSDTTAKQKSKNPHFAAMMIKARARAEEVVYVFSGLEDQLPLTQTQFELILINIQDQALTLQIKSEPAPEFKFQQYSRANDKGFIGVDSPEAADLIVKAIARITIKGVKFRGWRSSEMKVKHLVTCEISEFLAKCGVAKIVEAMIKRNDLRGEAISAWIDPHRLPYLRVFKFFADDTLHQELLLRRNGPLGADKG
jgi:hypothetical protein